MKTLVVLSALASIAIAAPALPEEHFDETQPLQNTSTNLVTREKKSPLEDSDQNLNTDATHNFESEVAAVARSIALKKPLVVKNKHGYRLYRDSEEEKALSDDSHQTCGRQIRVKLCDEDTKLRGIMRSSAHENTHTSEDDMKHSIKIAKEAVETLQRDLKKMEDNAAIKSTAGNSESEELHEEIEVARQALEHIHKNFGNLESMSLHATSTRDSDAMHDVHLTIANTEEERMAQWKKAIDNISKNVEIARNIEDSFKVAHETSLPLVESTASNNEQFEEHIPSHTSITDESQMRSMENLNHNEDEKSQEKEPSCKVTDENLTEHHARDTPADDMNPSASTIKEIQIDDFKKEALNSENKKLGKSKSVESLTDTTIETIDEPNPEKKSDLTVKASEQTETDQTSFKQLESVIDGIIAPTMAMNMENSGDNQKNAEKWSDDQSQKSTGEMKSTVDFPLKSLKNTDQILEAESKPTELTMRMENTDVLPNINIEGQDSNHHDMKSAVQSEGTNSHLDTEQDENVMFVKSVEQALQNRNKQKLNNNKLAHAETLARMKSAEGLNNLRHEGNDPLAHWAHENTHLEKLSPMKAAEEFMNEFHDHGHLKHMNFNEHHHMQGESDSASEFGMTDQTHSGKFLHNHHLMSHGNMADMRSGMRPNFHNGMRDAMEGHGSENMFRWNPTRDHARTAFGGGGGGGGLPSTGAVGVFPNANAGGCGIPLLLSCSPSVVSGSLAKPHPAPSGTYPAPAYRSEDEFSFHNKRDIKKNNEILTLNGLRVPVAMKQKSKPFILESKLENKL